MQHTAGASGHLEFSGREMVKLSVGFSTSEFGFYEFLKRHLLLVDTQIQRFTLLEEG
jgi:hypothetical protein